MEYSPSDTGIPGHNAGFSGPSDNGTPRHSSGSATVSQESGDGQFHWSDVIPSQLEELALLENGFVLALWGGVAVAAGAALPFVYHTQATVDGLSVASGFGIGVGYRLISCLFGLVLAGLALSTRRWPGSRRRFAVAALVVSLLGLAGYLIFALAGVAGVTVQTALGPAQVSWYPSIGALLSIGGCAADAIAAIVMLRTRTPR